MTSPQAFKISLPIKIVDVKYFITISTWASDNFFYSLELEPRTSYCQVNCLSLLGTVKLQYYLRTQFTYLEEQAAMMAGALYIMVIYLLSTVSWCNIVSSIIRSAMIYFSDISDQSTIGVVSYWAQRNCPLSQRRSKFQVCYVIPVVFSCCCPQAHSKGLSNQSWCHYHSYNTS